MKRCAAVSFLLLVSQAFAQNALLEEGAITCSSPVAPDDSADNLIQRYGREAVIQDGLTFTEDVTYRGVVILPRDNDRRIEVSFADEALTRVAGLTLRGTVKTSRRNVAGMTIGSTLSEVQKINGRPFLVNGFEWDYGGLVTNWKGGILGRPLPGGCTLRVRFDKDAGAPKGMLGEGVKISSDNATLQKWGPVVTEIRVNFPSR